MIKIRIDVDYSYPSRLQSFISTALNISIRKNYLKNSKILAKMINESPEEVMAYWFFTPQTTPDSELLSSAASQKNMKSPCMLLLIHTLNGKNLRKQQVER